MENFVESSDLSSRYLFSSSSSSSRNDSKRKFSKKSSIENIYKFPSEPKENRFRFSSSEPYCFSRAKRNHRSETDPFFVDRSTKKSRIDTMTSTNDIRTENRQIPTPKSATVRFQPEISYLEQARNHLEPKKKIRNERWKFIEKFNKNSLRSIEHQSLQRELNHNLIRSFSSSYLNDLRREEIFYFRNQTKNYSFTYEDLQDLHIGRHFDAFKHKINVHRQSFDRRAENRSPQNSISSFTIDLKANDSTNKSSSILTAEPSNTMFHEMIEELFRGIDASIAGHVSKASRFVKKRLGPKTSSDSEHDVDIQSSSSFWSDDELDEQRKSATPIARKHRQINRFLSTVNQSLLDQPSGLIAEFFISKLNKNMQQSVRRIERFARDRALQRSRSTGICLPIISNRLERTFSAEHLFQVRKEQFRYRLNSKKPTSFTTEDVADIYKPFAVENYKRKIAIELERRRRNRRFQVETERETKIEENILVSPGTLLETEATIFGVARRTESDKENLLENVTIFSPPINFAKTKINELENVSERRKTKIYTKNKNRFVVSVRRARRVDTNPIEENFSLIAVESPPIVEFRQNPVRPSRAFLSEERAPFDFQFQLPTNFDQPIQLEMVDDLQIQTESNHRAQIVVQQNELSLTENLEFLHEFETIDKLPALSETNFVNENFQFQIDPPESFQQENINDEHRNLDSNQRRTSNDSQPQTQQIVQLKTSGSQQNSMERVRPSESFVEIPSEIHPSPREVFVREEFVEHISEDEKSTSSEEVVYEEWNEEFRCRKTDEFDPQTNTLIRTTYDKTSEPIKSDVLKEEYKERNQRIKGHKSYDVVKEIIRRVPFHLADPKKIVREENFPSDSTKIFDSTELQRTKTESKRQTLTTEIVRDEKTRRDIESTIKNENFPIVTEEYQVEIQRENENFRFEPISTSIEQNQDLTKQNQYERNALPTNGLHRQSNDSAKQDQYERNVLSTNTLVRQPNDSAKQDQYERNVLSTNTLVRQPNSNFATTVRRSPSQSDFSTSTHSEMSSSSSTIHESPVRPRLEVFQREIDRTTDENRFQNSRMNTVAVEKNPSKPLIIERETREIFEPQLEENVRRNFSSRAVKKNYESLVNFSSNGHRILPSAIVLDEVQTIETETHVDVKVQRENLSEEKNFRENLGKNLKIYSANPSDKIDFSQSSDREMVAIVRIGELTSRANSFNNLNRFEENSTKNSSRTSSVGNLLKSNFEIEIEKRPMMISPRPTTVTIEQPNRAVVTTSKDGRVTIENLAARPGSTVVIHSDFHSSDRSSGYVSGDEIRSQIYFTNDSKPRTTPNFQTIKRNGKNQKLPPHYRTRSTTRPNQNRQRYDFDETVDQINALYQKLDVRETNPTTVYNFSKSPSTLNRRKQLTSSSIDYSKRYTSTGFQHIPSNDELQRPLSDPESLLLEDQRDQRTSKSLTDLVKSVPIGNSKSLASSGIVADYFTPGSTSSMSPYGSSQEIIFQNRYNDQAQILRRNRQINKPRTNNRRTLNSGHEIYSGDDDEDEDGNESPYSDHLSTERQSPNESKSFHFYQ